MSSTVLDSGEKWPTRYINMASSSPSKMLRFGSSLSKLKCSLLIISSGEKNPKTTTVTQDDNRKCKIRCLVINLPKINSTYPNTCFSSCKKQLSIHKEPCPHILHKRKCVGITKSCSCVGMTSSYGIDLFDGIGLALHSLLCTSLQKNLKFIEVT